jgi:plasmid stability protein
MKTLYLRNVPDDIAAKLATLADGEGMSVNAFAVRELTRIAGRADNAALFDDLPDLGITTEQILDAIKSGRDER